MSILFTNQSIFGLVYDISYVLPLKVWWQSRRYYC